MRLPLRTAAVALATAAAVVVGATAATATPRTSGAHAPMSVSLVPAFSNDLPKGSAELSLLAGGQRAAGVTPNAAWVCSIYTSDPWKSGIWITGDGTQTCTGAGYAPMKVNVTIQVYKGLGFWNNRVKSQGSWTSANQETLQPWYDCSGDGTYTYRIVTDGYAQSGMYTQAVQSLNYLRVAC